MAFSNILWTSKRRRSHCVGGVIVKSNKEHSGATIGPRGDEFKELGEGLVMPNIHSRLKGYKFATGHKNEMISIDITLIQETYKPNRPKACSIAGYVQLRTDRTYSSKGGTALYYRRSLHYGTINIPPLINMEATGCRLAMTGHSTLFIVSVYLPSPKRLLRRDLRALFALGDAVILFGDFNCKT
ncbi:hypothetical protein EVAR_98958_1 [Eumeta japonica]|uniref:Endonuclease/exonuclease/phosphatase domain-containing protein n=1 Tax=Eumeta variegata TaxID=151549 RepID=A0A4C1YT58_EUMVA|nr:hypothetical protein EVAR_98958_1 [Eumeta japonica]